MKPKHFPLSVIFVLIVVALFSQTPLQAQHTPQQLAELMTQINKRLSKYDSDVQIDSFYHQCQYYIALSDKAATHNDPTVLAERAVWRAVLAEMECNYLRNHLYSIAKRTAGASDTAQDWLTWDISQLTADITQNYQLALQDARTSQANSQPYLTLLDISESEFYINPEICYPTLYDLIAINFIYNSSFMLLNFGMAFDNPLITPDFKDSTSSAYKTIRSNLINDMLLYHGQDADKTALLIWEIENHNITVDDSLEEQHLKQLEERYGHEKNAWILFIKMGEYYAERATNDQHTPTDYCDAVHYFQLAQKATEKSFPKISAKQQENIKEITMPRCCVQTFSNYVSPQQNLVRITSRNCDSVFVYVKPYLESEVQSKFTESYVIQKHIIPVQSQHLHLPDTALMTLQSPQYGRYVLVASPVPLNSPDIKEVEYGHTPFKVTSLAVLSGHKDSLFEAFVMDYDQGEPVAGAKVSMKKKNKVVSTALTDGDGKATLDLQSSDYDRSSDYDIISVSKGTDQAVEIYTPRPYIFDIPTLYHVESFTDRAIYRPGQTVHWKGIVLKRDTHGREIAPNKTVKVMLVDSHYQDILTTTVTSNSFGSIAGEFQIPQSGFLGSYHITFLIGEDESHSELFSVEEYMRPTFEVEMEQPSESFRIGDEVTISGKAVAYAGYPVQNATVSYTVSESTQFPFRCGRWWSNPYSSTQPSTICREKATTDDEGNFKISFLAEVDDGRRSYWPVLHYTIKVTVTDMGGETHTQTQHVTVCDKALQFDTDIPEWVDIDKAVPAFPLQATNMSGNPLPAIIHYRVEKIEMPENFLEAAPFTCSHADKGVTSQFPEYAFFGEEIPQNWKELYTVAQGTFITPNDTVLSLPELLKQPAGAYKITLTATDAYGELVEETHIFYTTSRNSEKFTLFAPLKVQSSSPTAEVGETIQFTIGTYIHNAPVLVKVFSNDNLIVERWIHLDQSSKTLSYEVQPQQQGAYTCQAYLCHNQRLYNETSTINIPFSNKKIEVEFVTFRDKLQPGETSKIKIRFKDEFHKPLKQAELLCSMYDASLDLFQPHAYHLHFLNPSYHKPNTLTPQFNRISNYCHLGISRYYYYHWSISITPLFSWKNIPDCYGYGFEFGAGSEKCIELNCVYDSSPSRRAIAYDEELTTYMPSEEENTEAPSLEAPRSNFAETAFFYPFLQTNDKGEIEMEFTLPESLTRWKMLGLAHTQDMRVGKFEKQIVTQKPVMVVPNAPRFLYEGDRLVLSSKIVNTSELSLQGEVNVQFSDPVTGAILSSRSQSLTLAAGSTSTVDYSVDIPMGLSAVAYCVTARLSNGSTTYSDGETNTLPVLSRRQLVTETLPFFITHQGRKTFSLERLRQNSNNLVSCKMQFTPTPSWNVVLALPYLSQYPYECHEQLFSKLYANAMSAHILRTHPNLKTLLNDCRRNHPEALDSKLQQNEELMQVLLSETPWVMEAQQEGQDIQDIFCLFDEEQVKRETAEMVRKIENGQNSDGGWPWFAGGKSSCYITEHLLIGTGRLVKQGICQYGVDFLKNRSIQKAISFLDDEIEEDYQYQKKHQPKFLEEYTLGSNILHYLYARSFYPTEKNKQESYQFYKQHLLKEAATLPTFYQKTLAALTLYQWGTAESKALAQSIMLNIKENAQQTEEMGMFWKKEGTGYYWDDALIERQALMMEAFQTILGDKESVKEMEIWLLQQRRGNHWSTTRATADACYAVFCVSEEEHDVPASITLKICGETRNYADTLQIPVKEDVQGCLDHPEAGDIVLTTTRDGLSYGGVFYQYYADIDSITTTGIDIPLSVERKLYRVESGDKGEQLAPITEERPLRVGDKVRVRMEIRCDRDLEFVHLKDLRAATFEPADGMVSGYRWQDGLGYYQSFRDASVNFFFDQIRRGTYVFEYTLYVTQSGEFSSGYASLQCMYAPEFCAHSADSGKLVIGK